MTVYRLGPQLLFPPPEAADDTGLLAVGGDASPERLLLAYAQGIFPWPHRGLPLLWFSPEPRFVLEPGKLHVPRSLAKRMRHAAFEVRADTAFEAVIDGCAAAPRPGQDGTWITRELRRGFAALAREGFAHSIEAWRDGALVGGFYGVSLGRAFFGESMFAREPDASKVAFATAVAQFAAWDFAFVDCQVHTDHLARFGAAEWPRARFLGVLRQAVSAPSRVGPWRWAMQPPEALAALRTINARGRSDS